MRTQSAEVLNDADAFERKASWIAFQEEISFVWAWSPADPEAWIPGEPLFVNPDFIPGNNWDHLFSGDLSWGPEGNCVAPMYDLREDMAHSMRCEDCEVDWVGIEEPCFICGEERVPRRSFKQMYIGGMGHWPGGIPVVPYRPSSPPSVLVENMIAFDVEAYGYPEMLPHLHSMMERMLLVTSTTAAQASRALREMGDAFSSIRIDFDMAHMHMTAIPRGGPMRGQRAQQIILDEWVSSDANSETIRVRVDDDSSFIQHVVEIPRNWEELWRAANPNYMPTGPFRPELDVNRRMDDVLEVPINRRRRPRG